MSDFNDVPPPPDDFTKTTPNISLPKQPAAPDYSIDNEPDWAKTNYKIPKQSGSGIEDFGKTVTNIKPIDIANQPDFGKTMYPGAQAGSSSSPPPADWGATQANIGQSSGGGSDWGSPGPNKTVPYFQLPEAERAKYQQLPPTPTEQAAKEEEERKARGGIPGWVWVVAGLMTMFFFAILVLGIVYFFILPDSSFEVTIKGAPPGSDIKIDDKLLAVSNADGDSVVRNLAPGKKVITITHPTYTCDPITVEGGRGRNPDPVIARCRAQTVKATEDCGTFNPGEFDKAERCYNKALDDLPEDFTDEALVKALNILIINFDSGKYDVPPQRLAALQKGSAFIKKLQQREPNTVLEIGGHTDSDGNDASNQVLSENRAKAVKDVLVRYGVNGAGLQTKGYGEADAKFDNSTEQGKFLNRRIAYSIVKR